MRSKPDSCPIPNAVGCVGPVGPKNAKVLLVGEAAGRTEAARGEPFVGEAGWRLNQIIQAAGLRREDFRIANILSCSPPGDWLVGSPWEGAALESCGHCNQALEDVLSEGHPVVVPLGGTALRKLTGFRKVRGKEEGGIKVQDFHGAPLRDARDRFWIVPTFHPSYLNRGAAKLFRTCVFDLKVAVGIADGSYEFDPPSLVIDPDYAWFEAWADAYLGTLVTGGPESCWLDVDIETPDKSRKSDEGELKGEDASYEILYVNLSYSRDEGITVPFIEPYAGKLKQILEAGGRQVYHHGTYDVKRLRAAGIAISWAQCYDSMEAWHVLHSSLPKGLGFVAPFYSKGVAPWKHLGNLDGTYRALDGVQGLRVMQGAHEGLVAAGMWDLYEWRCLDLAAKVLRPAEDVGLPFDREQLKRFKWRVIRECAKKRGEIRKLAPQDILVLDGPYVKERRGPRVVTKVVKASVQACRSCAAEGITIKHRCADKALTPEVVREVRDVTRYWDRLPFNPASWQQVLAYIKKAGHKPGRARKTGKDTTDKRTLVRLTKTGDPFYKTLLEFRQADKMRGTYAAGILAKLDGDARVHGSFTNTPSTLRTASSDPNLQNLAHHVRFANDFRRCIVARPGAVLQTADYSAIEAVLTGYFAGCPKTIRAAKLGIHAFVSSHLTRLEGLTKEEPADFSWSDAALSEAFAVQKKAFPPQYDAAKRCTYLSFYGGTPRTMADLYPEIFKTWKYAEKVQGILWELFPAIKAWQGKMRRMAHEQSFLGGPGQHPFGLRHEFYDVIRMRKGPRGWVEQLGDDAKSCVAFYPQSTAGCILFKACLRLFDSGNASYIGDAYFGGRTPLRALIHDEIFLETLEARREDVRAKVALEMTRPVPELPLRPEWGMGTHLALGIAMKEGMNWAPVDPKLEWSKDGNPDGMAPIGHESIAADVWREEEEDEEEAAPAA